MTQVFCLIDTLSNVENVDEYDPIFVLCKDDKNNVIKCEKRTSEYFIHTVNIVLSDVEDDKEVGDIIEHLSEDSVGSVKDVQKMAHAEAGVGVIKPNKCYA